MPHMLFMGYGYCARELAKQLREDGWTLSGTCRRDDKRAAMESEGVSSLLFDRNLPLPTEALDGVTHALVSIPPDDVGDPAADVHGADFARLTGLAWLGLLSTTGVYGDHGGAWVTEDTPPQPSNERSAQRVRAEEQWLQLHRAAHVPVHIFRVAGIYGPGRNPLDMVKAGRASRIVKPGLTLGRIHVADIAGILRASIASPRGGSVFNVTDDEPVPPQDIVTHACSLLGVDPPPEIPFEKAQMPELMREFYSDNKRVSNMRAKTHLDYRLQYPTYRDGLAALNKLGSQ